MSALEVYNPAKNRTYVRRFDHDEAKARFAAGERISALADEYGVSVNAVDRIVHNRQAKQLAQTKRWRTGICEECGGAAMRLVSGKKAHNRDGRVLCITCRGRVSRTNVRFDAHGVLTAVCCVNLDCVTGDRWQPPRNFPKGKRYSDLREGGFHNNCRACLTAMRRAYRETRKVPCSHGCGRRVLHENGGKTPECHPCAMARVKRERRAA